MLHADMAYVLSLWFHSRFKTSATNSTYICRRCLLRFLSWGNSYVVEVFRTIVLRDEEKVGLGNWILIVFCRGVPVSRQKDGGVQMSTWVVFLL